MELNFISLGEKKYQAVLTDQFKLREARRQGQIPDTILLVEHPRVITAGRRPADNDFLIPPQELKKQGFAVEKVNRGGKLTYHGPGQLVVYFILSLPPLGLNIPRLVHWVEQTGLETLEAFDIEATRRPGLPGLWVGEKKIASLGLAVDRGISMHGMALNVCPNLSDFKVIVPCGMSDCEITSIHLESPQFPSLSEVARRYREITKKIYQELPAGEKNSLASA
jgi:lipoate-protein ligase B